MLHTAIILLAISILALAFRSMPKRISTAKFESSKYHLFEINSKEYSFEHLDAYKTKDEALDFLKSVLEVPKGRNTDYSDDCFFEIYKNGKLITSVYLVEPREPEADSFWNYCNH
jgi:hypothetical protein